MNKKSNLNQMILFLFLFLFISAGIPSANILFGQEVEPGKGNRIEITCESYKVQITKDPFQVTFNNHEKDIGRILELFSEDSSGISKSLSVKRYMREDRLVHLVISGTEKKYYNVNLILNEKTVEFQVSTADNKVMQKLGLRLDLILPGHWYGGTVVHGHRWPLEQHEIKVDNFLAGSNQTSPIWITSRGFGLISETYSTMGYSFNVAGKGVFELFSRKTNTLSLKFAIRSDIVEAFGSIADIYGKPSKVPPAEFFKFPQFNTWIEFLTKVNQDGVEKYTRSIRTNGFPAKIFMIDDKWTPTYGDFDFDPVKFPDPLKMVETLHKDGFQVALWVTPFVEEASSNYKYAAEKKYLIMDENGKEPYIRRWWNGQAAIVDLSNPEAYDWFLGMLVNLRKKYGIDGYKLDGGDATFLDRPYQTYANITPNRYADLYVGLGQHFDINELKIGWLAQSMGLVQRLRDKGPNWTEVDGIRSIIPHAMTAGMIGYSFLCADMVGGGLDQGYLSKDYKFDEELFVRWTEASALMPMMQFSLAPWKISKANMAICKKYSELHVSLGDYIYSLAEQSKATGIPLVRPLFFEFPSDENAFMVKDQFMLGERFLVAPVLEKGAVKRNIYLPPGTWIDYWNGRVFDGNQTIEYAAPLDVLPVLVRAD